MIPYGISKIKRPSDWTLEQEGHNLDDNGKDTTHPMYGVDRKMEKNGNWQGGIKALLTPNEYAMVRYYAQQAEGRGYQKKGHGARLGLKRGKYKPRVKK